MSNSAVILDIDYWHRYTRAVDYGTDCAVVDYVLVCFTLEGRCWRR